MSPYRNALVTGASSGIGRALAIELARAGAPLCILAARRERELDDVAREVRAAGGRAVTCVADVGDTDAWVARVRRLDVEHGGLDLIVANAAVGAPPGSDPIAWETLREPFHVNVCGAVATLTSVLPAMVERGRGHLLGIGSISAYAALPGAAAYSAPKAALQMLLDCLRLDVVRFGIAVTHARLGFVRTSMVAHSTHPMPQLLEPAEVAKTIVRRLPKRPREIVLPRALAVLARAAGTAPEALRELALARRPS